MNLEVGSSILEDDLLYLTYSVHSFIFCVANNDRDVREVTFLLVSIVNDNERREWGIIARYQITNAFLNIINGFWVSILISQGNINQVYKALVSESELVTHEARQCNDRNLQWVKWVLQQERGSFWIDVEKEPVVDRLPGVWSVVHHLAGHDL